MKDNRPKGYIYFLMEKKAISIFYLGIAEGEIYSGGQRGKKTGLPVRRLKDRLEYPGGSLQIFYALLPEFEKKVFGKRCGKAWNEKSRTKILEKTLEHVQKQGTYYEILSAPELSKEGERVPLELWAAYLHQYAPLQKVCVVFSKEGGPFEAREAVLLLSPYLKRINQVILACSECAAKDMFSDYLYYEYGIIPESIPEQAVQNLFSDLPRVSDRMRGEKTEELREASGESQGEKGERLRKTSGESQGESAEGLRKASGESQREKGERLRKTSGRSVRQRAENVVFLNLRSGEEENTDLGPVLGEYHCINSAETLKFLDTTIKNGYNTES